MDSSQQNFYTTKSSKTAILSRKINQPVPCRHIQKPKYKPTPRNERDNIPGTYTLIYQNSTETYVKLAGIMAVVLGCSSGLFLYVYINGQQSWDECRKSMNEKSQLLIIDKDVPLPAKLLVVFLYSGILIGALRIYRTAVYRMYRNFDTEQYMIVVPKVTFKNNSLAFTRNIAFQKADMKIYPLSHLRWLRGDFKVKGRGVMVDRQDFAVPKFFHDIFGADYEYGNQSGDISAQQLTKSLFSGISKKGRNKS